MDEPRPVLMLLPGLLCDQAAWAGPGWRLTTLADCRIASWGMLDSIEAMASHLLASVPEARFALAGHSMGGRVALEVVRQAPQRVERLALLDTGFQPLPPGPEGDSEREARCALLAQARSAGMRSIGRNWATGMVHPDRVGSPLFDEILDMIDRSNPAQFAAQVRALLGRPDATQLLPAIACPTLLLCGRQDRWNPLAHHVAMRERIPAARLEVIEDAGHMTTMEAPQAVAAAMAAWLTGRAGPECALSPTAAAWPHSSAARA
ncbi:alpha/beta hydrolase [Cupriavidus sp. IDO]|nr:alpha/beta hydrolase [Cupriavidus sp. IDO]